MNKKTADDVIESIKERLSSPISGTFIFVWLLCNWRIIFLASDNEFGVNSKILGIEGKLNMMQGLLYPLVSTIIYLLIMPWIRQWYREFSLRRTYAVERYEIIEGIRNDELKEYGKSSKEMMQAMATVLKEQRDNLEWIENTFSNQMKGKISQPQLEEFTRVCKRKITAFQMAVANYEEFSNNSFADDTSKAINVYRIVSNKLKKRRTDMKE